MAASFRDQVIKLFTEKLGEAEQLDSKAGPIFRWTLQRGPYDVAMFITIDSPEWPDMAHVMISDATNFQADPVISNTLYTIEEAAALLDRIEHQWKQASEATQD